MIQDTPIRVPKEWPDIECRQTVWKRKIPLLGSLIGYFLGSRYEALEQETRQDLVRRNFSIEEAWSEFPQYMPIVLDLHQILATCWGFPPLFIPEDQYGVIGQVLTGDLCEVEAVMEIESVYGVKLLAHRRLHPVLEGTMLDVVRFLHEKRTTPNIRPHVK